MRFRYGLILVTAILGLVARASFAADRPNVVVFLADDLTWSDCPPTGGTMPPTPNMLRLTNAGLRLIDKKGTDAVIADLRAGGMKI